MLIRLSDRRTPTCTNCGMAKLETEDIIDTCTNYEDNQFTEYTIGVCPNCGHTFSYTLEPTGYDDLIDITEDEEEEEDDT